MLICADGSSKQRGHLAPLPDYGQEEEVLAPSGSAALYRRAMLDEIGGFDEDFFLYCEDTDLGLRARWAGWRCLYAPDAVVDHHYSHTAGRATPLKAFYVERNRLFLLVKNFPPRLLLIAPLAALARYGWHVVSLLKGRGVAARFREDGHGALGLSALVIRAPLVAAAKLEPALGQAARHRAEPRGFHPRPLRHCCAPMPSARARWPNCERSSWS